MKRALPIFLICLVMMVVQAQVQAQVYSRTTMTYEVATEGNCWNVAWHLYPGANEKLSNHIAREIGLLNSIDPYEKQKVGTTLICPRYKTTKSRFCGDLRNWKYAVAAGREFGIAPALLIGIRSHENPKQSRDHYAYGVKKYKGTDLKTQSRMAARALSRYGVRWNPSNPSVEGLVRVGRIYCPTGPSQWAKRVHWIMRLARGK